MLFLLSPLVVYPWRFVRNGMMDGGDDVLSNLPMLLHSARALLSGHIFWTPSLWLGTQLLEEPEFATFYLPRLVLLAFSPVHAFAVYVIAHYVLAQFASYAYARSLDLSRGAAVFGALVYAYSGFMLGHRGHTMYLVAGAWAPLFLMFLRRLSLGRGRFNLLGAALCFAALPLSGALQLTAYLAVAATLLQSTEAVLTRSLRPLGVLALALVPAFMLGALQILPSIGLSRELVELPGDRYTFSNVLSYDPRLLPLLLTPLDPSASAEMYSRVGGIALVFAVVAALRRRDPSTRGWLVVAGSALVLMLGSHVPVLPRVLNALPLVDVFRGPARHNFEFGLALSVLSAFGFDTVFTEEWRSRRLWLWGLAAVGIGAAVWELGTLAARSSVSTPDTRALASAADAPALLAGALLVGFAVLAAGVAGTRARRVAWALVLLGPLVDARVSLRRFDRVWPDWGKMLASADVRNDPGSFARVLPPPMSVAGPDALAANVSAAFPGLGDMLGYASRAHLDAATLFDLDLHGHPRLPIDLAWSRLPTVFGVGFVTLPEAVCPPLDFGVVRVSANGPCAEGDPSVDLPLGSEEIHCRRPLIEGRARFGVQVDRVQGRRTPQMLVHLAGRGPEAAAGADLDFHALYSGALTLWLRGPAPEHGWLTVAPTTEQTLVVDRLGLVADSVEPIAEIDVGSKPTLSRATTGVDSIELEPHGSLSRVQTSFQWSESESLRSEPSRSLRRPPPPRMELEVVARAASTPSRALFVDLYGGPDFDPMSGQMAVEPPMVTPFFSLRGQVIDPPSLPPEVALRALYEGDGSVELKQARFLSERRRSILAIPGRTDVIGTDFRLGPNLRVWAIGMAKIEYHLPTRPVTVEVVLDARPGESRGGPVVFGVRVDPGTSTATVRQRVIHEEQSLPARFTFTTPVPLTAGELQPFAAVQGRGAVEVRKLTVKDACSSKPLRPVRTLESGWVVYRDSDALPRVYTVGDVRLVPSIESARDVLRDDSSFDPRKTALLFEGASLPAQLFPGRIERQVFGSESLELDVRAPDGPTLVVVNDHFHERWRATVDGVPTPIARANGLVRAVVVPAGAHLVRMRYDPPWTVPAGAAAAGVGLLLALGFSRRERRVALGVSQSGRSE